MKLFRVAASCLTVLIALNSIAIADITIGAVGPITGPNARLGVQLKNGVEQAIEDINAGGGILGEKVELVIADDASDPKQGVSVASRFAGDNVKFVVGNFVSGVAMAASPIYNEAEIIQLSAGATNPKYSERGFWNVFRVCGRDDQQGAVAAEYLAQRYKDQKIAIVHDKSQYGKGLADETKKAINSVGLTEVAYLGINPGEKDYSALVSELKAAQVDLVYYGGEQTEAGLIIRQMSDQGLQAKLMGGDALVSTEFAAVAGPNADGTLMTFSPDPRKNAEAAEVVERFQANGIDPEAYTLYSYSTIQVLKQAAEAANSLDPVKVAEAMHSGMTFKTVLGEFSFNEKGDITSPGFLVYEWNVEGGIATYAEAE